MEINKPLHIHVIDDDPINNYIIRTLIDRRNMNADLTFYNNGVGAINGLNRLLEDGGVDLPDYIFVDLLMPVMDGWEFLDKYEKMGFGRKIKTRMFVLTSSVFTEDKLRAAKYGFVEGFISKPATTARLDELFN